MEDLLRKITLREDLRLAEKKRAATVTKQREKCGTTTVCNNKIVWITWKYREKEGNTPVLRHTIEMIGAFCDYRAPP